VNVVGDKVTIAKEAIHLRNDCDKMKANVAKLKIELKLRKQAIKEAKYEDNMMMMDTSMMSLADALFYEATIILKRFGHLSSTE